MPIFHAPELEWNLPCRFAGEKNQSIHYLPIQLCFKSVKGWIKPLLQAMVKTIMKWSGVESEIGEF